MLHKKQFYNYLWLGYLIVYTLFPRARLWAEKDGTKGLLIFLMQSASVLEQLTNIYLEIVVSNLRPATEMVGFSQYPNFEYLEQTVQEKINGDL